MPQSPPTPTAPAVAAQELIALAVAKGVTLGSAESCTGGMIAAALTDIPGSSQAFWGSIVSYANEVKMGVLGVQEDTLARVGAVSEEVALQMAAGACKTLGVHFAVSTTGVAGPDGGTARKPVGTVWIGVAGHGSQQARLYHFAGDRAQIRKAATSTALEDLLEFMRLHTT